MAAVNIINYLSHVDGQCGDCHHKSQACEAFSTALIDGHIDLIAKLSFLEAVGIDRPADHFVRYSVTILTAER